MLAVAVRPPSWRVRLAAYVTTTKPRIMALLLLTTVAAFLVAARAHGLPAVTSLRVLVATIAGGGLAAGGASALNCYIDRDIDVVMARTRRRPLPAGTLSPAQVLHFGLMLSALSLAVLAAGANVMAALLALSGNIFYVVVYTLWLKRRTTQNIVLGGIAGAIPPLVGWAAAAGRVELPAVLMLVLIACWTPAHFWALALMLQRDYRRAGLPMLPAVHSAPHAARQIMIYTLLVLLVALLLYVLRTMGLLYLLAAIGLGAGLVAHAVSLLRAPKEVRRARALFLYSNVYLAALFAAMVLDRLIGA
jgi:protoheme IX farnesyltransferase